MDDPILVFDGEVTREMNEAEAKQHALDLAAHKKQVADLAARETARQNLLDRLGITADEVRLLLE